jgi:hypothetical protein
MWASWMGGRGEPGVSKAAPGKPNKPPVSDCRPKLFYFSQTEALGTAAQQLQLNLPSVSISQATGVLRYAISFQNLCYQKYLPKFVSSRI